MLKDYPATQLFLISLVVLMVLVFITPLVREWSLCAAILDSLKFIIKVVCGFLLIGTVIDVVDGAHFRKQKRGH